MGNPKRKRVRLRLLREGLGFTRVGLAAASGLSATTIRIAENGYVTRRTAEALAPILGLEPKDLLPCPRRSA